MTDWLSRMVRLANLLCFTILYKYGNKLYCVDSVENVFYKIIMGKYLWSKRTLPEQYFDVAI